jgi:hypothetical protein
MPLSELDFAFWDLDRLEKQFVSQSVLSSNRLLTAV